jgi:hypothetical protein
MISNDFEDFLKLLQDNFVDINIDEIRKLFNDRDKALEAARLLCANLRRGGTGHMTLVENFEDLDADVI